MAKLVCGNTFMHSLRTARVRCLQKMYKKLGFHLKKKNVCFLLIKWAVMVSNQHLDCGMRVSLWFQSLGPPNWCICLWSLSVLFNKLRFHLAYTGVSRGFAFVEFHNVADAQRWMEHTQVDNAETIVFFERNCCGGCRQ